MTDDDLLVHAQAVIDANLYLTLGTDGHPWTSPVYFAPGDREFFWLSATDSEHSRNLAEDPHVSVVIFESTVAPYHGRAVYAAGEARELSGDDVDRALTAYPRPGGDREDPVDRRAAADRHRSPAPPQLWSERRRLSAAPFPTCWLPVS